MRVKDLLKKTPSTKSENIDKRINVLIFSLVLLFCGYFYSNGGWSQVSRYDAVFSFVENESKDFLSFRIDRFIISPERNLNTGDWARHDGHYYSNKAPGVIILGVLAYFPIYYTERIFVEAPFSPKLDFANAYIINLLLSGLLLALATVYFRKMLTAIGLSRTRSVIFSLILALCTPLFPYANSLWGHTTSTAFIIFALYHLVQRKNINLFFAGFFIGIAVNCDYMTGVYAVTFTAFAVWRERSKVLFFLAGGLAPLLLFMWYHWICFGSPLSLATLSNNPIFLEQDKVGGIFGNTSSYIMLQLLFGARRGLLFVSPVLLFAFAGFYRYIKSMFKVRQWSARELLLWLCLAGILLPLFINASFNGWHSGASISPRYLLISLPFWVLPMAFADYRGLRRWILLIAGGLSFANMVVCGALTPIGSIEHPSPLFGLWYPKFFSGQFLTNAYPQKLHFVSGYPMDKWYNFNLASLCGLNGLYSLVPLFIIAIIIQLVIAKKINLVEDARVKDIKPSFQQAILWLKKQETLLLVLFAAGIILALLFPGDSVWINDEPLLLEKAFVAKNAGHWATDGLTGTVGMTYGPQVVWFYQILMLFSCNPVTLVFLKTVIILAALLYACAKISRLTGLKFIYAGIFLTLSPYIYFYNRMLWDNVMLIPLTALSLAFLIEFMAKKTWFSWFMALAFSYICLYIHPMSLPWLAALIPAALIYNHNYIRATYKRLLIVAGSIIIPVIPFVYRFITQFAPSSDNKSSYAHAMESIITSCMNLTFYGWFEYFLPEYQQTYPEMAKIIKICGTTGLVFVSLLLIFSICCLVRKAIKKQSLNVSEAAVLCCIAALVINAVMTLVLRRPPQPHYNNAITIAAMFIVWWSIIYLNKVKVLKYIVYILFISMFGLMINLVFYIHIYNGSRSMHYGATLSNQWEVAGIVSQSARIYKGVKVNFTSVSNYLHFPHGLATLIKLHRPYEPKEMPRVPENARLTILHPNEYPSGKIIVVKSQ